MRRSASSSRPSCSARGPATPCTCSTSPTTGLHPADVELLTAQLARLTDAGNTVVVVEHAMDVVASADHVIDMGPSGGDDGGRVVAAGTPAEVAASTTSRTAPYLRDQLGG